MLKLLNRNTNTLFSLIIATTLSIPIAYICYHGIIEDVSTENQKYLLSIIPTLSFNSFTLLISTLIFSSIIGIYLSCTLSLTNIRYKKLWRSLTFIPLSLPLYVAGFIYQGAFDFSGGIATYFRNYHQININNYISFTGPIWIGFIFSLYLSPYLTTALIRSLDSLGRGQWPIAKTIGLNDLKIIKKIVIPSISPWGISALIIISMEVLSDFGGVSAFNYDTLTTGIYTAWSGLYSYGLALKISFILMFLGIILFFSESHYGKKKRYSKIDAINMSHPPIHLKLYQEIILTIPVILYYSISIVLPIYYLISWSLKVEAIVISEYVELTKNTVIIATITAFALSILSIIYSNMFRNVKNPFVKRIKEISLLGYSLPGPIVAISIIGLSSTILNKLSITLSYQYSIILLIIGLSFRYLLIGEKGYSNSFKKIQLSQIESAKVLGISRLKTFYLTVYPIIKANFIPIFILLTIEVMKELPITLMLRPYKFSTLPVKIYEYTSEGEWEKASVSALILIAIATVFTFLINRNKKLTNEK